MKQLLSKAPNALPPLAIAAALLAASAFAESVDPSNTGAQYAYGANIGWLNAEPNGDGGQGITVTGTKVTGWLYGANVGWISLHCDNPEDAVTCATNGYGVTNDGAGNLSGYAYGANIGWISFSCQNVPASCASTGNYGVTVNPNTGLFAGKAYSANTGWINFEFTTSGASRITVAPDADAFAQAAQPFHRGPSNTDATKDNCLFDTNPGQENADGNHVDTSPPYVAAVDDKTWPMSDALGDACDTDRDNDGLSDAVEATGSACTGTATNPLLFDTDGDRARDGAECSVGTNPTLAASAPTLVQCGAAGDADGDKIQNRLEFCYYGTSTTNVDSDGDAPGGLDGDGGKDGCEVASINSDQVVNSGDQGKMGSVILLAVPYHSGVDLNKDGFVNSGDQGIMASFISPPGQCP
jgi:hypothetical protein